MSSTFQLTKEQSSCIYLLKGIEILFNIFIHVDIRTKTHIIQYSAFDIYANIDKSCFLCCAKVFGLISKLSVKYELKMLFAMAGASFFIYLFHEPWLGYLIGMIFKILHPSGLILWILPCILVTVAVCYSYLVYLILNKYAPRLLSFITGSRV